MAFLGPHTFFTAGLFWIRFNLAELFNGLFLTYLNFL